MTTTMIASDRMVPTTIGSSRFESLAQPEERDRGDSPGEDPAEECPDVPQVVTGALDEEDRPALLVPDLVLLVNGEYPLAHEESVAVEDRLLPVRGCGARSVGERRRRAAGRATAPPGPRAPAAVSRQARLRLRGRGNGGAAFLALLLAQLDQTTLGATNGSRHRFSWVSTRIAPKTRNCKGGSRSRRPSP